MALEPTKTITTPAAAQPSRVTSGVEHDMSTSVEIGMRDAGSTRSSATENRDAAALEFGRDGKPLAPTEPVVDEPVVEAEPAGTEPVAATAPADATDLGEYKAGDAEVQAKFDARYFKPDGTLNRDALATEFWANYNKLGKDKAGLHEGTYGYLKETLGLDKETVKDIEAALVTRNEQTQTAFYQDVGGKDRFEAAVKWGKEGGYTDAQRARFNAALQQGGLDAEDAVVALMARFDKVSPPPAASPAARKGPPGRRGPSTPVRNATQGAQPAVATAAAQGAFATTADYQKAWAEGIAKAKAATTPAEKRAAKSALEDLQRRVRANPPKR